MTKSICFGLCYVNFCRLMLINSYFTPEMTFNNRQKKSFTSKGDSSKNLNMFYKGEDFCFFSRFFLR